MSDRGRRSTSTTLGPRAVGESTGFDRFRGRTAAALFGSIVTMTDFLPPRVRYGYVHRLTRLMFRRSLPVVSGTHRERDEVTIQTTNSASTDTRCVLATDHLDVGGIGSVIEMLALGFSTAGVSPVVVCHGDGQRAQRLRDHGIDVKSVSDSKTAMAAIRAANADVIQLHSAPSYLEQTAITSGVPLVTAMHNTEIHFTEARWTTFTDLLERSASGIAVSETVREFHVRHVPPPLADRIVVVANGAPSTPRPDAQIRRAGRHHLEQALGVPLGDDVVFLCLARYDAQKNVAGTVASFLRAIEAHPESSVRLVYAGDPSDWAELRRADGIRRSSRWGDRIHLLANSDAATLLTAADVFVLNSFFEGWPVAATEAAAAGVPALLSDVGGAAELVARDPERSMLIANASGNASEVSDARVRVARRRSRHQANQADFVHGVKAMTAIERRKTPRTNESDTDRAGVRVMVNAHAAVVRAAAGRDRSAPAG